MRKLTGMVAAVCAALFIAGCASGPTASEEMASARKNAPDGALVGMATDSDAAKVDARAKRQLGRAISSIVKNMIDADIAAGKLTPEAASKFQESVLLTVTSSKLEGAEKLGGNSKGKEAWAAYYIEKAAVVKEINAAVSAAKAAYPAASGFTIEGKIDQEFRTAAARDWKN